MIAAAGACLVALAGSASGQMFRGVVLDDSTKQPLASAVLTLLDGSGREVAGRQPVRSDSVGRFSIPAPGSGRYRLRVTRIGYAPLTSAPVNFLGGEAATLTLAMSAVATRLGSVVVTERRRLNGYELLSDLGFELRRSKNVGRFLDTADLKEYKRHPSFLLLSEHAGLGLYIRGSLMNESLQLIHGLDARGNFSFCQPELWVDGFEQVSTVDYQWRLHGLAADQIHGIEVYRGPELPSPSIAGELGSRQSSTSVSRRCGLIVVWTKAFVEDRKKRERGREGG
jgi:hypothetical protein